MGISSVIRGLWQMGPVKIPSERLNGSFWSSLLNCYFSRHNSHLFKLCCNTDDSVCLASKINQPTSINAYVLNTYFKCTGSLTFSFIEPIFFPSCWWRVFFSLQGPLLCPCPHWPSFRLYWLTTQINKGTSNFDPGLLDVGHSPISWCKWKIEWKFLLLTLCLSI